MLVEILLIIVLIGLGTLIYLAIQNGKKNGKNISDDLLSLQKDMRVEFEMQKRLFESLNEQVLARQKDNSDSSINFFANFSSSQKTEISILQRKLEDILKSNETSMQTASLVLQNGLKNLQESNEKKLELMRQTVDEKLTVSLERRLSESFNVISNQLESVYKGLGEMQNLALGVGDLKRVLSNVKNRGVIGEIQLGNILEQMLAPNQFERNVATKKGSQERVDFAVIFPGKNDEKTLLPIDSKFPIEDYQRLCLASEAGNEAEVETARKDLIKRVNLEAKSISEKYINLPYTTDFAIMFLPTEGLFAEVLRSSGTFEKIQSENKVLICGPTTLTAILSSLQMGFRTLSIEKRSSEIWKHLGVFKQEFTKFVDLLEKTQKKLSEASNTIELATKSNKRISKTLSEVSSLGNDEPILIEEETSNNDDAEAQ
ncbi:MAG: DNA recombination protein RmuC [Clostridia bacterium]